MGLLGDKGIDFRKVAEAGSVGLILPSSIAVGLFLGYMLGLLSLYRAMKKYM
jgi:hypothetical protein